MVLAGICQVSECNPCGVELSCMINLRNLCSLLPWIRQILVGRFFIDMAAVKVPSALCLTLLLMALLLAPIFGREEACDEWLSETYHMLLICSSKICNDHCIGEGGTRGKCGLITIRAFCFCTKECD